MAAPEATAEAACTPVPIAEDSAEPSTKTTSIVASAHAMKPCAVSRKKVSSVDTDPLGAKASGEITAQA
jgi:hypothetical protein